MRTIYLCGAINGCTDSEATDWREKVKRELYGRYEFLDPMRRDYRGCEDENVNAIVRGDIADIEASDVLLVAAGRPSWGTAMETWYAARLGSKRIEVVCSGRVSPWLRFCADRVHPSLDAAIAGLREEA